MNTLLIDASSDYQLCILYKNESFHHEIIHAGTNHSGLIFPSIESILSSSNTGRRDIDRIVCGTGPGSFTGIRIAVSTARMISQVLNAPLMGVPTQKIFAALCAGEGETFLTAFDAKKGRVFAACYAKTGHKLEEIVAPGDYYPDELAGKIGDCSYVMTGSGCEKYSSSFSGNYIKFSPVHFDDLLLLIEHGKESFSSPYSVTPLYTRKSDAEVMKDMNAGKK